MHFRAEIMWKTAKDTPPIRRNQICKVSWRFIGISGGGFLLACCLMAGQARGQAATVDTSVPGLPGSSSSLLGPLPGAGGVAQAGGVAVLFVLAGSLAGFMGAETTGAGTYLAPATVVALALELAVRGIGHGPLLGVGTGAVTYTLANAVISACQVHGAHRQFGQGTLTLTAFSSDGITNPISTSIAP